MNPIAAKAPAKAPAKPAAATEALVKPVKKAASKPTTTVAAQPAAAAQGGLSTHLTGNAQPTRLDDHPRITISGGFPLF
jgi:hypothetical protein